MSRRQIGILLAVFAGVLVFGYSALLGSSNDPRPIPTDTPGPAANGGGGGAGDGGADADAGEALYQAQCASCHSIDGSSSVGPSWLGLIGREVNLDDGSTVVADEEYIRESILEPQAKVHEGFQPIMPPFQLTDQEIDGIIAFMQSLE